MTNSPADIQQNLGGLTPSQIRGHWQHKDRSEPVRVMGVVEGYVVARYKSAVPFLTIYKRFLREYSPIVLPPCKQRDDD